METINILLTIKYKLWRDCLRTLLESYPHLRISAEIDNQGAVLSAVKGTTPDVILLDTDLVPETDLCLLNQLASEMPEARVIVVSDGQSAKMQQNFLRHGAKGIVFKQEPVQQMIRAIETVSRGELWMRRSLTDTVLQNLLTKKSNGQRQAIDRLTEREREIVPLVVKAFGNKQIADALGIKESTVRHHLTSIYGKCGVSDRVGLVVFAFRSRLVALDEEP